MIILTNAISAYRKRQYTKTVELVDDLKENNINKHRFITCAYSKRFQKGLLKNEEEVKRTLEKILSHSKKYIELSTQFGKKAMIGYSNRANALAFRNQPGDLEEALKLYKKAIKESPTEGFLYSNSGIANYLAGNTKKAIQDLKKACDLGYYDADSKKEGFKTRYSDLVESNDNETKEFVENCILN